MKITNIFSGIGNKIKEVARSIYNDVSEKIGNRFRVSKTDTPPGSIHFTIDTSNVIRTISGVNAIMKVYGDKNVTLPILEIAGKKIVEFVQEELRPFKRTGSLERSWQYKVNPQDNSVIIFSHHPAAIAIQTGYKNPPTIKAIIDWMDTKKEFAHYKTQGNKKEKRRTAFNIQQAIERETTPGPQSTFSSLSFGGERVYDYAGIVQGRIQKQLEKLLSEMTNAKLDLN